MLELIVVALAVSAMVKVAAADGQSSLLWGSATFALSIVCIMLIPYPFLRIGAAFALAFCGMIAYKVAANR
jgi:hypothetical protein